MQPSRIDTLNAPPGAARAPLLVFAALLLVVAGMVLLGLWGPGWLTALLLPMVVFTLYVVVNVIQVMAREVQRVRRERSGSGRRIGSEEE